MKVGLHAYESAGSVSADSQAEPSTADGIAAVWRYRAYLLLLVDLLTVSGSFMVAYYLRFHAEFLAIKSVPIQEVGVYLKGALLLTAVWVFLIWRDGGYETGLRGVGAVMIRVRALFMSAVYAIGLLMAASFLYRGMILSRQVYLMTGVIGLATMVLGRLLFRAVDRDLAALGVQFQRAVMVGANRQTREFLARLGRHGGGLNITGILRTPDDNGEANGSVLGHAVLGDVRGIREVHASHPFNMVLLCGETFAAKDADGAVALVNFCEEKGVALYMLPGSLNIAVNQQEVGSFSGMPLIRLKDAYLHPLYGVFKRIMDIVASFLILVLGLPVWIATALVVKLSSKGPVLFSQIRSGLHGQPFRMYKFRTMVADAEERLKDLVDIEELEVPGFKIKDDPRVTTIGRFLRRTSIDEIPQVWNVLKGEMSLVGPRPEMPALVSRYTPEQRRRLKAKPGITGYQQVMARGIPLAAGVKYDLIYLKHQSFFLDLYILLWTLVVLIRGKGVTH